MRFVTGGAGLTLADGNLYLPDGAAGGGIIYSGFNTLIHSDGLNNFFAGQNAGSLAMGGNDNTGSGNWALQNNTTGIGNTANGSRSLHSNTNGNYNTASGASALYSDSSGYYNTANGTYALYYDTAGYNNIALGAYAGFNITTGGNNIDIGNSGAAADDSTIRLGTPGIQMQAFIAGVINGNGGGLTNLSAASLNGNVGNAQLANNSITINAGSGLAGGGTVPLGGAVTLNNAGVVSVTGNADITAINNNGAVALGDNATDANTAGTLVKRDASGNFSAGTVAASLAGNAATATVASNVVSGIAITNASITDSVFAGNGGGLTNLNAAQVSGTFTGNVIGSATSATTAATANNFSGPLAGDVTGTQGATVVATVGGSAAVNIHAAEQLANAATSANTANAIVKRDASGNISAGSYYGDGYHLSNVYAGYATSAGAAALASNVVCGIAITNAFITNSVFAGNGGGLTNLNAANLSGTFTGNVTGSATSAATAATANNFSGQLAGDVTGTQGATVVATVGNSSAANLHVAEQLANAATGAATANTIVKRDAAGGFAATNVTVNGNLYLPATTAKAGIIYAPNAATLLHCFGTDNFFAGLGAGNLTMSGRDNAALGYVALNGNTTGSDNTAGGSYALYNNLSGSYNTAYGANSLQNVGFGANPSNNTAIGYWALNGNMSGDGNTAVGSDALGGQVGSGNIALGFGAGANTTGSNNIVIGNNGVGFENGTIRIGTPGIQTNTFIAGMINGNGGGLTNLNAAQLAGGLTIQNNMNGAPNVIEGAAVNYVAAGVVGATIGGGGATNYGASAVTNSVAADFGTVGGGGNNTIQASARDAAIGGGYYNTIQAVARDATIGGGWDNTIQTNAEDAAIGGGYHNTIQTNAQDAAIGGGFDNTIQTNAQGATIGGGEDNTVQVSANDATIGGGENNTIQANGKLGTIPGGNLNSATNYAFAAGNRAKANNTGAFVWADSQSADFASTGGDQFLIRAQGGMGVNKNNPATALDVNGTVTATSFSGSGAGLTGLNAATLTGGLTIQNNASGAPNVIEGSSVNYIAADVVGATIGGGGTTNYYGLSFTNSVAADFGTVSGGLGNTIQTSASDSIIGGGLGNIIQTNANVSTIGGGYINTIQTSASDSTIAGGQDNTIQNNATYAAIGGGYLNVIQSNAQYATIPGGYLNSATNFAFAAGNRAKAKNTGAFVWADSQAADFASSGSDQFLIRAQGGMGVNKNNPATALDVNGTVTATNVSTAFVRVDPADANNGALFPGLAFGLGLTGEGISSKRTLGIGWASLNFYTSSTLRMRINNDGNVGIGTTNDAYLFAVGSGTSPAYCNGTTWQNGSDRNGKESFAAINPRAVLEKVSALPITEWKYKVEADGTEHLGPMAQDFHAAFGLNGADDKHIATVDEEGVALAAIQGLNQKLNEKDAEIEQLQRSVAELKTMVEKLAVK